MSRKNSHHPLSLATLPLAIGVVACGLFVTLLTTHQVQRATNLRPKALNEVDQNATPIPSPNANCYERQPTPCIAENDRRGNRSCIYTRRSSQKPFDCTKNPVSCTPCKPFPTLAP